MMERVSRWPMSAPGAAISPSRSPFTCPEPDCGPSIVPPRPWNWQKKNARTHGVESRIEFLQGDLLTPLQGQRERLTAVISNPPYVSTGQLEELPVEIREHEPRAALDGGRDGLEIIRRLIPAAAELLSPEGWLALEIGAGQARRVETILSQSNVYRDRETIPDYAGIPRVVLARKAIPSGKD